ncbi:MAG: GxxExxY protein [Gemmatimonadaceae bacterium]
MPHGRLPRYIGFRTCSKAVETLQPIHAAQLRTYLRLGNYPMGLLLNFGRATLRAGLRRFVNSQ